MERLTGRCIDRGMDRRKNGQADKQVNSQADGKTDKNKTDIWVDIQTDGRKEQTHMKGRKDEQTHRWKDGEMDEMTDGQTDTQMGKR